MKANRKEDVSLNFMPVFADLGTIIIGFFIFIVVVLLKQLSQSEHPTQLSTDQYFNPRSYSISDTIKPKLSNHILQKIYPEISIAFKENRLKNLRIEGHTDPRKLKAKNKIKMLKNVKDKILGIKKEKNDHKFKVTNNYELSFMRAQSVGDIFKEIIDDDPTISNKQLFKDKIVYTAHGASILKYGYREEPKGSGLYAVFDRKVDTLITDLNNLSEKDAKDALYKKLRRVEITSVIKGLRQ